MLLCSRPNHLVEYADWVISEELVLLLNAGENQILSPTKIGIRSLRVMV